MRVATLRTIALSMIFVLFDAPVFGINILPDIIGLLFVFICSFLIIDKAPKLSRAIVLCVMTGFIEAVFYLNLIKSETVLSVLSLFYAFLIALLVLSLTNSLSQYCKNTDNYELVELCDITGFIYTIVFVLHVSDMLFPELLGVFWLARLLISAFTGVMFFVFYVRVRVVTHTVASSQEDGISDDDSYDGTEPDDGIQIPLPFNPEE